MGILERIRMNLKVRSAIRDARIYANSLTNLSSSILTAAYKCTEACDEIINEKYGKDTSDSQFMFLRVVYEYLFFILHMTDRIAFSDYGPDVRARFQDELLPLIQKGSTETFCGHWPDEIKEKLNAEFVENINLANIEYAKCKLIYNQEAPLSPDSIIGLLGKRISDVLSTRDLTLSVLSTTAGMQALSLLHLKENIASVCKKM